MFGEHLAGPTDQPCRRLVPGAGDDRHVGEDLLAAQSSHRARLVLELRLEQFGHQVVGGVLGAPVDVLGELRAEVEMVLRRRPSGRPASVRRLSLARSRIASWSASGMPSSMRDDAHRHLGAEVADEVEAVGADERVEAARAELTDLWFEFGHAPRSEHPRQQAPVDRVGRRVFEDQDPRRHLDAGLDDLEDAAACRR